MIFVVDIQVSEEEIEEMFCYADKDCDGKISYQEFQVMINPPKRPTEMQPGRKFSKKKVTIKAQKPETLSVTNFMKSKHNNQVLSIN